MEAGGKVGAMPALETRAIVGCLSLCRAYIYEAYCGRQQRSTKVARPVGAIKSTHCPDLAADDHNPAELLLPCG